MDTRTDAVRGSDAVFPGVSDWGSVITRYRPLALRLARGIVGRAELAEDLVQDAARAVLELSAERRARFESASHARNYFLRTVHNRAVDALRHPEQVLVRPLDPDEPPGSAALDPSEPLLAAEEDAHRSQALGRLARALTALRPPEQEAVRLRYLEGLSLREVSERTGAPISTVHSRIEAALERIRRHLGKEGGPP